MFIGFCPDKSLKAKKQTLNLNYTSNQFFNPHYKNFDRNKLEHGEDVTVLYLKFANLPENVFEHLGGRVAVEKLRNNRILV